MSLLEAGSQKLSIRKVANYSKHCYLAILVFNGKYLILRIRWIYGVGSSLGVLPDIRQS